MAWQEAGGGGVGFRGGTLSVLASLAWSSAATCCSITSARSIELVRVSACVRARGVCGVCRSAKPTGPKLSNQWLLLTVAVGRVAALQFSRAAPSCTSE